MDVISLGKAKKAKQAIKETQDRLGYGGTEQDLDIRDKHENTKKRLEELEKRDPGVELFNRVSKVSENTTINLNKHNLRVGSLINHTRYKLSDMVVDDFEDDSGIDYEQSSNIAFDQNKKAIHALDPEQESVLVTISESASQVNTFVLSTIFGMNTKFAHEANLSEGYYKNTIYEVDAGIRLNYEDGLYALEGIYESNPIFLGEDLLKIQDINLEIDTPEGTDLQIKYAFSKDGNSFTSYRDSILNEYPYVKIKFLMKGKIESAPVKLLMNMQDNHSMYDSNNIQLRVIGEENKLVRNLHQYTPIEYDKESVQLYGNKIYRLTRKIDKGWNR